MGQVLRVREEADTGDPEAGRVEPDANTDDTDPDSEARSVDEADAFAAGDAVASEAGPDGSPINTPPPPGMDGRAEADSRGSWDIRVDSMGITLGVAEEAGYSASTVAEAVGAALLPVTTDEAAVV